MKNALRLLVPELYQEWEKLARDFEPVVRVPSDGQSLGVGQIQGMSADDLLVWRGVIEAALPFQRERALELLRCRRAMLGKLVEAGIDQRIGGTWQRPGDPAVHKLTSSIWVMVEAAGQPLDWLIDLLGQRLTLVDPDGTKTVLSGVNVTLKRPVPLDPAEETPARRGRKPRTPSTETADALAPDFALTILDDEAKRPLEKKRLPKGRGQLAELSRLARDDLKNAGHDYARSTVEKAIRQTFQEWTKKNPDKKLIPGKIRISGNFP
jgi:hypothetical protein